jgi:hypothetical protein
MKAFYGFNFPKQTYSKSSSPITKEASAVLDSPATTLPYPFFKSIIQVLTTGPPFLAEIPKL